MVRQAGLSGTDSILRVRSSWTHPIGDEGTFRRRQHSDQQPGGALRFQYWPGEGFHTILFATDSEYVVEGSTKWAKTWVKHGWAKRKGGAVKNQDIWEALLGEVERYKDDGMDVQFWRIPRECNAVADEAAKMAAAEEDAPGQWKEIIGINIYISDRDTGCSVSCGVRQLYTSYQLNWWRIIVLVH